MSRKTSAVIANPQSADRATQSVVLRLPASMLKEIDDVLGRRTVRIPRHTWVLEAVAEKLHRERTGKGGRHGA